MAKKSPPQCALFFVTYLVSSCRKSPEVHGAPTAKAQGWASLPAQHEAQATAPGSSAH